MDRAIVNARGAARWLRRQHPWIYRSDLVGAPEVAASAVEVADERGTFLGTALWSPRSTICLRMLTRERRMLDGEFWRERLEAARRLRERLEPHGNAYRLVHAEADGLPSLVVDRYDGVVVLQLLSAGLEAFRQPLIDTLHDVFRPTGILARNDVPVRTHEGLPRENELLSGAVPEEIEVTEGGVRYLVTPWTGQKTGAFLDQRENRQRAGELARGRALDCFTYQGSFALHLALAASEVVAVDSSAESLHRATSNAALNGAANISFELANVFDFLRAEQAANRTYDIVVLDPPAFAKRRDALDRALRGYKEINLRAMRLLAPGGILCTFSCSYHVDRSAFRAMLVSAATDAGRTMRWIENRGQALDHPELLHIPESGYLKGAILQAM